MSSSTRPDPRRRPPGPKGVPVFGSVLDLWKDPFELLTREGPRHGDLVHFRFGPSVESFVIANPEHASHVLLTNQRGYIKGRTYGGLRLTLGQGLVTSEFELWRKQRRVVQPMFRLERIASFAGGMTACTAEMLESWAGRESGAIDVHAEMMRLTLRIVGRTLFGTDVDAHTDTIAACVPVVLQHAVRHNQSAVPLPPWVPTPRNRRFLRALRTLDAIVFGMIDERRRRARDQRDPAGALDLVGMLIGARDESGAPAMDDRQIRDEVVTMLGAGHETTATALSWLWTILSRHPDVERRLHTEVSRVLGSRMPTLEDLPSLDYTERVILETLRLYPPVWCFDREAAADDELAGYPVPAGSVVAICPYLLHRHPDHWPNPEGFDPDRFLPEPVAARARCAFLPFGAGPRQCVGERFAMMEAKLVVAMVVQRYRLELEPHQTLAFDPSVTLRPRDGVRVRLRRQAEPGATSGR